MIAVAVVAAVAVVCVCVCGCVCVGGGEERRVGVEGVCGWASRCYRYRVEV